MPAVQLYTLLLFLTWFLSGQADSKKSKKRSAENGNSIVTVADTALPSNNRPSGSDVTAQHQSCKKRQHALDAGVLTKTPGTDGSRILAAAVSGGTQHSEDTATVCNTESNYSTEAIPSSTYQSKNSGTVPCTEINYDAGAIPTSTHDIDDSGTVRDTENSSVAAGEAASSSTQCCTPAETALSLTHIVSAAGHAAVIMHHSIESHEEPIADLENNVQSSNASVDFG